MARFVYFCYTRFGVACGAPCATGPYRNVLFAVGIYGVRILSATYVDLFKEMAEMVEPRLSLRYHYQRNSVNDTNSYELECLTG